MAGNRASIFDEEPEDNLDVSGFAPKAAPAKNAPTKAEVREVSEAANFPSRQPARKATAPRSKRLTRTPITGRNKQFNVKATQETIDAFYAIADRQGWVLGETLEHALAALDRELSTKPKIGK